MWNPKSGLDLQTHKDNLGVGGVTLLMTVTEKFKCYGTYIEGCWLVRFSRG